jgi:hypothetical protein
VEFIAATRDVMAAPGQHILTAEDPLPPDLR